MNLEDVFKKSGIPTYTFVKPSEYNSIIVALRTKGRCVVVEGPSGIGKTTCIQKVIEEIGLKEAVLKLSGRAPKDASYIEEILSTRDFGIVIIDDFHVLPDSIKQRFADLMKLLADEEKESEKLILIGINKAGDSLVQMAPDLNNRIDTIKFERNPDEKVRELIGKGESALNIEINTSDDIVLLSKGSFHIAQYLCSEICTLAGVLAEETDTRKIDVSIEIVKDRVLRDFSRLFYDKARAFAIGPRLRREGRAPYLHLLYWLSESDEWSIQIDDILNRNQTQKLSILQIVDKGYLQNFISSNDGIKDVVHYDSHSRILTVEDPKFMFYLRNLLWNKFAKQIGYIRFPFTNKYDYALSFAGENRNLAERIYEILIEADIAVFYDKNEQSRILAENVEDYLAPIYNTEARFVVPLLSSAYPSRVWTKFESEVFKHRFGDNSIIPVWYSDSPPGMFDISRDYGGVTFKVEEDLESQAQEICSLLIKKLSELRADEKAAEAKSED